MSIALSQKLSKQVLKSCLLPGKHGDAGLKSGYDTAERDEDCSCNNMAGRSLLADVIHQSGGGDMGFDILQPTSD